MGYGSTAENVLFLLEALEDASLRLCSGYARSAAAPRSEDLSRIYRPLPRRRLPVARPAPLTEPCPAA